MPQDFEKSKPRRNNDQDDYNESNNTQGKNGDRSGFRDALLNDNSDVLARRDPAQSHDYKGEAQNVNDDTGRPLNDDELEHARNKAMQGLKQGNADISDTVS